MKRRALPHSPLVALGLKSTPAESAKDDSLTVRLPDELEQRLARRAAESGRKRAEVIAEAVRAYLDR